MERTANGIEYDNEAGSTDFSLYPVKGKHKPKDIQRAKFWLRDNKQAQRIQIRWNIRDGDDMPQKLPGEVIISQLKIELGKKEAYISELEYQVSQKQDLKLKPEDIIAFKKDEYCKQLKKQISVLTKKVGQSRKDISRLISEIQHLNGDVPKSIINNQEQDEQHLSDT